MGVVAGTGVVGQVVALQSRKKGLLSEQNQALQAGSRRTATALGVAWLWRPT